MFRRFLALALCLCGLVPAQSSLAAPVARSRLPAAVAAALKEAGIPRGDVAILVRPVDGKAPRLAVNADQAMNPASVMKLLTTYAALDLLGPAHTWTTTAYAARPPRDGVLDGDLHLQGSGDPKLTFEQFWLLLRQLRDHGVREIRGDLILDRGAFALPPYDPGAFDGKPMRPYNAAPDALLLAFATVRVDLAPAADGSALAIAAEPAPANLEIINLIRPVAAAECGEWKDGLRAEATRYDGRTRLVLSGDYPLACGEKVWGLAAQAQPDFVYGVFRKLWTELGGSIKGGLREGPVPAGALPLAAIESPPLADIVRDINKFSNNVMARELYLALGHEVNAGPLRPEDGEAALRRWLEAKHLACPHLALENGAGLSRRERIDAACLGDLLADAWKSPLMPEFAASLPLAGEDGTMKKRVNGDGVAGQAHIKTGSLDGVKAIAGYVQDRRGRRWIVVFLVNHANASAAKAAQDALLEWIYER
jgi:D-alanyl-D-alanine carboxypeptidase/D-alanyl-D-alanine-endopeptidase (penicillin-binding protein 4)